MGTGHTLSDCTAIGDCQNRRCRIFIKEFAMASSPKPPATPSSRPARHAFANTLKGFKTASGKEGKF